ncbi:MAG: hypothetical protein F6J93_22595 [Oscillatoria sp. SIO1A7]|nr:hypothetical protein [Oscillatoria sp. SIO1A7]
MQEFFPPLPPFPLSFPTPHALHPTPHTPHPTPTPHTPHPTPHALVFFFLFPKVGLKI